jgi:hypothetical protein
LSAQDDLVEEMWEDTNDGGQRKVDVFTDLCGEEGLTASNEECSLANRQTFDADFRSYRHALDCDAVTFRAPIIWESS